MIRSAARITILLLACSAAPAAAGIDVAGDDCNVDSDYSIKVDPNRLVFTHERAKPVVELLSVEPSPSTARRSR